ncbi:MAG: hypothetical protein HGB08_00415 [Candidatus Moranbacteria bacterium]|nr:hypothetical protein [Candidatus Moranbacteria bacterium]
MTITIEIKNKVAKIILKDGGKVLDELVFPDEYRISKELLPGIESLLRKNSLEAADIEKVDVETDLGETFTSRRIAEATANAFNWDLRKASV